MTTVYIVYPGDAQTRFDHAYYAEKHLKLVSECWTPYGLNSLAVFYPEHDGAGTIAICSCLFRDEAAVKACFDAPRTPEVMADVQHFTDAKPLQLKMIPL